MTNKNERSCSAINITMRVALNWNVSYYC